MADSDLPTVLIAMLQRLPNVRVEGASNHTTFLVGAKVFAYTRGDHEVVIKLPKARVDELMGKQAANALVMGARVMKEWAVIAHEDARKFSDDLKLFRESMTFVSGKN